MEYLWPHSMACSIHIATKHEEVFCVHTSLPIMTVAKCQPETTATTCMKDESLQVATFGIFGKAFLSFGVFWWSG